MMNRPEAKPDTRFSSEESQNPILVAGVGSFQGDDQWGWLVVDQLTPKLGSSICCRNLTSPHQLLDHLDGVRSLILCDAAVTDDPPGTWQRLDWPDSRIPASRRASTHSSDWNQLLGLAHHLHPQLQDVSFWILSGTNWEPGAKPTTEAINSLGKVVEDIRKYVKTISSPAAEISSAGSGGCHA